MNENVGVLAGSFDPVHRGHIAIAEESIKRLKLVRVVFLIADQPRSKNGREITPISHRIEMVRRVIENHPAFDISIPQDPALPSYGWEILVELRNRMGPESALFFLMGWDALPKLARWKYPERLIQLCRIVAIPRAGYPPPDLEEMERLVPGIKEALEVIEIPRLNISSSEVRERLARNLPVNHLIPSQVEKYIRQQKLYKSLSSDVSCLIREESNSLSKDT